MHPARFEDRKAFLLTGSVATYRMPDTQGIPGQWREFSYYFGKIPGQLGWTGYGVCFNMDGAGKMDYMCGMEVAADSEPPEGLTQMRIESHRYAVFEYRGHISNLKDTWAAILKDWAPTGHVEWGAPQFEVYGREFNPETGTGLIEIWIPIAAE